MFTDYAKILIKSGDGGNGAITFRREKYVAARSDQMEETGGNRRQYIFCR